MIEEVDQHEKLSRLDFVTKHYAVLSTLVTIGGVILSTLFISSYLAVFDKSLIWLIELADLAKFGILSIALVTGSLVLLHGVYDAYQNMRLHDFKLGKRSLITVGSLYAGMSVIAVIVSAVTESASLAYRIFSLMSFGAVGFVAYFIHTSAASWMKRPIWTSIDIFLYLGIATLILGHTYGLNVKDVSKDRHDVQLKNGLLNDVVPILILSHHSVYRNGDTIITIPSSDIIRVSIKKPKM